MKQLIAMTIILIITMVWVNQEQSKVKYVNANCPNCYGVEVLDFGHNQNGEQKCHCANCNSNFIITND